ncbi:MalY/PatB family protein [Marinobacter sp. F4216]|uniref:MalY/PatB family protein n=1 Tax=Marinobacter sp. F4216 TaxID=2874281 RepID=UPI001CBD0F01|nr:PatB family C-S lyase [Marinobacter sp. F4216]MBZ2169436.1 PatB family C-S lyase [Marinobacter sp. F4216]
MVSSPFDQSVNRDQTCAVKFDARKTVFGREDVIPAWVADMDFAAPEAVTRALVERARHPVYGYTLFPDSLYQAMMDWYQTRHGWRIEKEWILMVPGVVPSLNAACLAFAKEGEGVIIQPPVYPPFFNSIRQTGRTVIENPLIQEPGVDGESGQYRMNLDHLEACAAQTDARMLMLCSPHNPVGRVWSRQDLEAVLDIARRHDLVVLSDEIHCDLTFDDSPRHHVLATLARPGDKLVTAVAPSKSFNLPGLGLSALVIEDEACRRAMLAEFQRLHVLQCNPFSAVGFETGYREGGPWLDELRDYLKGNRDYVVQRVRESLPGIRCTAPEATYLMWLDCRDLGLSDAQLKRFFVQQAGVGLNPGITFGEPGSGYMRLNMGCPRSVLTEVLDRIEAALRARG